MTIPGASNKSVLSLVTSKSVDALMPGRLQFFGLKSEEKSSCVFLGGRGGWLFGMVCRVCFEGKNRRFLPRFFWYSKDCNSDIERYWLFFLVTLLSVFGMCS